jgi:hypothetical protein
MPGRKPRGVGIKVSDEFPYAASVTIPNSEAKSIQLAKDLICIKAQVARKYRTARDVLASYAEAVFKFRPSVIELFFALKRTGSKVQVFTIIPPSGVSLRSVEKANPGFVVVKARKVVNQAYTRGQSETVRIFATDRRGASVRANKIIGLIDKL